jgi:Ni/Co efflux regulator RcnB
MFEHKQEKEMNKLLSVIVAALFAVSTTAFVASPVGAQTKDEKKTEKKAKSDKKAAPKKDAAPKKEGDKKAAPKKDAKKKDEAKK